ncbi:hypothetical protein EDD17DRAFT_1016264 [Pisolithus thermaeus]|nr:hypothetical protein EDD17DRAFT_1016264 [Pisolithus thermaeus]
MDTFQRLLFGFSRQQDGQRLPPSRKLSSANLSNDTAQPVAPSSARSSVRMSSETTESRILPSGVHSQGNVSSGRAAIDKTQSMPRQSTSRVRRGNSVADENTEHPPSALPTSFGNSIPTSLTEHSPQVPLEDCPKDYGIEAPSSGTPYDARPHGPESGPRPTFKPPTTPSPLRHEDASRADNSAVLTSTTALRRSGGSHGSDAVSSQTIHPPRPSIHRNDSLESRNISNEMTQSQGVASPLPCGGTSDAITNGAQAQSFAPTNNVRLHRPDLASRPTTQSQMVVSSLS